MPDARSVFSEMMPTVFRAERVGRCGSSKNDEPDALGINWRVEKIVRLPNLTNGIEICDGN